MKNIHATLYILAMGLALLPSCKAKNDKKIIPPASTQVNQIYSIYYGANPNPEKWYEYLANGDLSRQYISTDTVVFKYSDDKIIKSYLNPNSTWQSKISYQTDSLGRVITSIAYDKDNLVIGKYQFEYNTDGYLAKTTQELTTTGAVYTNEYNYDDGNLKEMKAYDQYGKYSSKYAFAYYSDLPNLFNINIHQIMDNDFPNARMGKMNKNMTSQLSNISKEGDTLSLLTYKYGPILNDSTMKEYQSDVLNDFETEIIYHFKK